MKTGFAIHSAILIISYDKRILYASDYVEDIFHNSIDKISNQISCNALNCRNSAIRNCPNCKLNAAIRKLIETGEQTIRHEWNLILSTTLEISGS